MTTHTQAQGLRARVQAQRAQMRAHQQDLAQADYDGCLSASAARAIARAVYDGWRSWYFSWHWPGDDRALLATIAQQSAQQADEMRAESDILRARAEACRSLSEACAAEVLRLDLGPTE